MVEIVADNQEIEDLLTKLHDLFVQNGGMTHEGLRICCREGALSLEAPRTINNREKLIECPHSALLPVDLFDLRLEGDDMVIGNVAPEATAAQTSLMEIMLDIYNATGKIAYHRTHSLFALKSSNRELYLRMAAPAAINSGTFERETHDLLDDFLHTRTLGAKLEGNESKLNKCLMPIIDFFNHHAGAPGFNLASGKLSVVRGKPLESTKECFVSYGRYDARRMLVGYGFVDTQAGFVTSIPMDIELPGVGKLNILGGEAWGKMKKLPAAIKDIRFFMPTARIDREKKVAVFSPLIIPPPQAPRAMRRVLTLIIGQLTGDPSPSVAFQHVDAVERQVIDANKNYYSDLKTKLAACETTPDIRIALESAKQMVDHQLVLVAGYSFEKARS